MKIFHLIVIWVVLALFAALAALSGVGAFLGSVRAQVLFSSTPLIVVWSVLAVLLLAAAFMWPSARRSPGLMAMHLGSFAILLGSMWGSAKGHQLAAHYLGITKVPSAYMVLSRDKPTVLLTNVRGEPVGRLRFQLLLHRFWIEYYPYEGRYWPLAAGLPDQENRVQYEPGKPVELPGLNMTLTVLKYLPSVRPVADQSGAVIGAEPDPATELPALQVEVKSGNHELRRWLVARNDRNFVELSLASLLPGVDEQDAPALYLVTPPREVKDYKSDVSVIVDGKEVERRVIEVNYPLHFGGYHFYQFSYDEAGLFSQLSVSSDSGLYAVFGGFVVLAAGAFYHFWLRPAATRFARDEVEHAL